MSIRIEATLHACGPGCRLDGIVTAKGLDLQCMAHGPLTFVQLDGPPSTGNREYPCDAHGARGHLTKQGVRECNDASALLRKQGGGGMRKPLLCENVVCTHCGAKHIDQGEWAQRNHSRHLCAACHRFFFTDHANVGVSDPPRHQDGA